eukprot:GHVU01077360.1.p3 GENE.GHVU01077360.1~~GHVU01077360.1.p3  ORF type:complete len:151 (-),score=10.59 GHVU01077360.1:560-1012(-)
MRKDRVRVYGTEYRSPASGCASERAAAAAVTRRPSSMPLPFDRIGYPTYRVGTRRTEGPRATHTHTHKGIYTRVHTHSHIHAHDRTHGHTRMTDTRMHIKADLGARLSFATNIIFIYCIMYKNMCEYLSYQEYMACVDFRVLPTCTQCRR